jgi:hypothetical protein
VSVTAAADVATLPVAEQTEIVARGEREILEAAKTIRGRRAEQRRTERIERLLVTTRQSAQRCAGSSGPDRGEFLRAPKAAAS